MFWSGNYCVICFPSFPNINYFSKKYDTKKDTKIKLKKYLSLEGGKAIYQSSGSMGVNSLVWPTLIDPGCTVYMTAKHLLIHLHLPDVKIPKGTLMNPYEPFN